MSIYARNETDIWLKMKDYYLLDPTLDAGYYGAIEYIIPARGKKTISATVFTRKAMERFKTQQIHVQSGENTLKIMHHEDFQNNKGKELIFEMGSDGELDKRFVTREEVTIAQRFWCFFAPSLSVSVSPKID